MTIDSKPKVMLVDDEAAVLRGITIHLRRGFVVSQATSGAEALQLMAEQGPFAVVVSDMRMPGMSGVEFLAKSCAEFPDTTRVLLTGQADLESAMQAVNDGQIFRFLSKPTEPDRLRNVLTEAARQNQLVLAERELLEQTLRSSVKVLTDVLSLVNPEAFSRATRIHEIVEGVCRHLAVPDSWQVEVAALLSQLGCVTLPPDTLVRAYAGAELSAAERQAFDRHRQIAHDLIAPVARLETTAAMLTYQRTGPTPPRLLDAAPAVLGGEILTAASRFEVELRTVGRREALEGMRTAVPPEVLTALANTVPSWESAGYASIDMSQLQAGMVLRTEVRSAAGVLLAAGGTRVSEALLERLLNFAVAVGIPGPIEVVTQRGVKPEAAVGGSKAR